jgi:hypothetical protein
VKVADLVHRLSFLIDFAGFEVERKFAEMTVSADGSSKFGDRRYGPELL